MKPISSLQLRRIMPAAGQHANTYAGPIDAALARFSMETVPRSAAFLAQVARESEQLIRVQEDLNYSAAALHSEWPEHFDPYTAAAYQHQSVRIANRAYANRMGNGDEASGDGWKYRGRALLQITGKDTYAAAGKALELDLVNNPDLALTPDNAALIAAWYWESRGLNALADAGNFSEITRRITGSNRDDANRLAFWHTATTVLNENLEEGDTK